jgi:hypothetical protein
LFYRLNAISEEQTALYLRLDVLNTALSGKQLSYFPSIRRRRERKARKEEKRRSELI